MPIDGAHGLEQALSDMLDRLDSLVFENAVTRMLVRHAASIHVLQSGDVHAYFQAIRETSRANLARVAFDPDALEDADAIRVRVLAAHDRMFDDLARSLGLLEAAPTPPPAMLAALADARAAARAARA